MHRDIKPENLILKDEEGLLLFFIILNFCKEI